MRLKLSLKTLLIASCTVTVLGVGLPTLAFLDEKLVSLALAVPIATYCLLLSVALAAIALVAQGARGTWLILPTLPTIYWPVVYLTIAGRCVSDINLCP